MGVVCLRHHSPRGTPESQMP